MKSVLLLIATRATILGLLSLPVAASADCPSTCATAVAGSVYQACWTEGTYEWVQGDYFGYGHVTQDLAGADIRAQAMANLTPAELTVFVYDEFELHDAPSGETIPLRVRLPFHYVLHTAKALVSLYNAQSGLAEWKMDSSSLSGDSEVTLTISALPNVPFQVRTELYLKGMANLLTGPANASGDLLASWAFEDLPPGASIVSCRGYAQTNVAAQRTTWSRVRAAYR